MSSWIEVCSVNDIHPNTGVCALINDEQVALFRVSESEEVYALGNYDPIGKANVMSRGLLAQFGETLTVASPLYKQHYNLKTGECLEEDISIPVYDTKISDQKILIKAKV